MEGRVTKGSKRGRMSLKALALSSAEASPNASPVASDTGIMSDLEAEADNSPSLRLEASNSPSLRAELGDSLIANRADLDNLSPITAKEAAAASLSDSEEGATAEVTSSDALPRSVSPVPVTHANPNKRPKRLCAISQPNPSAPETYSLPSEATPSKATPSKATLSKVTPNKATPSKVTPSKRGREAAGGSPGWVAEHAAGVEAAVQGGTPGKRRRSLLPPAMLSQGPLQVKAVCCCCFNNASASPGKACALQVPPPPNLCRLLESLCVDQTATALLHAGTQSLLHVAAADTGITI